MFHIHEILQYLTNLLNKIGQVLSLQLEKFIKVEHIYQIKLNNFIK